MTLHRLPPVPLSSAVGTIPWVSKSLSHLSPSSDRNVLKAGQLLLGSLAELGWPAHSPGNPGSCRSRFFSQPFPMNLALIVMRYEPISHGIMWK
jgi:hypothetical protein